MYEGYDMAFHSMEIQGKSILVRVSARFELSGFSGSKQTCRTHCSKLRLLLVCNPSVAINPTILQLGKCVEFESAFLVK